MQSFNKYELPASVTVRGLVFTVDLELTKLYNKTKLPLLLRAKATAHNFKYIRVNVLSRKLRIRQSLTDTPHQPSVWIFTTALCGHKTASQRIGTY